MTIQAKSHFLLSQATLVFCLIIHLGASLRKQPDFPENQIRKRNVNYGSHQRTITLPYKTGPQYDYDEPDNVQYNYEGAQTSYQPQYSYTESETYSSPHYVSQASPGYNAPIYKPSKSKYYDAPTYNEPNGAYVSATNGYNGYGSPYASSVGGYGYPFGYSGFGYGTLPYSNYGATPYASYAPPPQPYPYTPNYYPQIVYNTTTIYPDSTSDDTSSNATVVPSLPDLPVPTDLLTALLGMAP